MTQVAVLTMAQLMPDEAMSVVEPAAGVPMPMSCRCVQVRPRCMVA